ncbi:MAG TPA: hypothetical protein VD902_15015, partial [Symbiobacteriaceae bacterium]|nr:hypothetical protein [Symbiobacteriaceae bacterium]
MAQPSTKTRAALVAGMIVVLLAGFLLSAPDSAKPAARHGVIDLTEWRFADMGSVGLDGEWSFYWQQLLTPEQIARGTASPDGFLSMPGSWSSFDAGAGRLPSTGYATLRLQVDLPDHTGRLAMQI